MISAKARMLTTILIISTLYFNLVYAQRDDFIDLKPFWIYHDYGVADSAEILGGYAKLSLSNPQVDDPSNCGIGQEFGQYLDFTYRARVKALTDLMPGTRGWGMWLQRDWTDGYNWAAWFIEQNSPNGGPMHNIWGASTLNGQVYSTVQFHNLEGIIDNQEWHTYEIVKTGSVIDFYVDDSLVWNVTSNTPNVIMGERSWNDNFNYFATNPFTYEYLGWSGTSSHVVDFMEVYDTHPGQSISPDGMILLRELPDEIGTGQTQYLWKEYEYTSSGGTDVVLITARAEHYVNDMSDDDDIRIIIDDDDFGWDTFNSFNGNTLQSKNKTLAFTRDDEPGVHAIQIYGDITPLLYDVSVIGSSNGNIIIEDVVDEEAPGGSDYLWKEYNFSTIMTENVTIAISATADDNYQIYDDDDIRIVIDEEDLGWNTDEAFSGEELFGEARLLTINRNLSQGEHLLQIYADQTPTLHYILIYGEYEDNSLPISLSSFSIVQQNEEVVLNWTTESEVDNLGFNIFRATGENGKQPSNTEYLKINDKLIEGAGTTSSSNSYEYYDSNIIPNNIYWYKLEDVSFNGEKCEYNPVMIKIESGNINDFSLFQNYPNPFNPKTSIHFTLKNRQFINLNIYNIKGQLIRTLLDEEFSEGEHSISWDGRDANGKSMVSGIYYYRLSTNSKSTSRKMMLLK